MLARIAVMYRLRKGAQSAPPVQPDTLALARFLGTSPREVRARRRRLACFDIGSGIPKRSPRTFSMLFDVQLGRWRKRSLTATTVEGL